jgi:two-component system chemotaxis response regulator CheB
MSVTLRSRPYDVVAIATSGGGLAAVRAILAGLPSDFPATLLVVQHRWHASGRHLEHLLAAGCKLRVRTAATGMALNPGDVLVAPPDRHLEITAYGACHVERMDRVNYCCPAADVLFTSLARHRGRRTIACVLTGSGSDGAAGVKKIRAAGGFVLVQSPRSAAYAEMPYAAIETRKADLVLPLDAIAYALSRLTVLEEQAA